MNPAGTKCTWAEVNVWARLAADLWNRTGRNPTAKETRTMLAAARIIAANEVQE